MMKVKMVKSYINENIEKCRVSDFENEVNKEIKEIDSSKNKQVVNVNLAVTTANVFCAMIVYKEVLK